MRESCDSATPEIEMPVKKLWDEKHCQRANKYLKTYQNIFYFKFEIGYFEIRDVKGRNYNGLYSVKDESNGAIDKMVVVGRANTVVQP